MASKSEELVNELKEILWRLREVGKYSDDIIDVIDAYDYLGIADGWAKPNTIKSFEKKAQNAIDQYNDDSLETKRIIGLSYVGKSKQKREKKSSKAPKRKTVRKCKCK
jgi:hypothetical protein